MKKSILSFTVVAVLSTMPAQAESIKAGSTLFIECTEEKMTSILAGQIGRRKIPFQITRNKEKADYLLEVTGHWDGKSSPGVKDIFLAPQEHARFGAILFDTKTDLQVWADDAGDKPGFFSMGLRRGLGKVADRLAGRLKRELTFYTTKD